MSLPTLSLDGDKETSTAGINTKPSKRPLIEKSASSASIVRNRDSRVQRLGKSKMVIFTQALMYFNKQNYELMKFVMTVDKTWNPGFAVVAL